MASSHSADASTSYQSGKIFGLVTAIILSVLILTVCAIQFFTTVEYVVIDQFGHTKKVYKWTYLYVGLAATVLILFFFPVIFAYFNVKLWEITSSHRYYRQDDNYLQKWEPSQCYSEAPSVRSIPDLRTDDRSQAEESHEASYTSEARRPEDIVSQASPKGQEFMSYGQREALKGNDHSGLEAVKSIADED